MANIGRLTEVDVRDLWQHEQYDFSNWLAKESNLEYLNDILGLRQVWLMSKKDVIEIRQQRICL